MARFVSFLVLVAILVITSIIFFQVMAGFFVPLFLAAGMGLAYLGAFHAPAQQELPVGIVGQGAATQVFAQTVTDQSDGALVAHVVASTKAAEQQVRDRDLAAVYAPTATRTTRMIGLNALRGM